MRQRPGGFVYPEVRNPNKGRYTLETKRDVVALYDEGYWPLDIAVAYGIPVYNYPYATASLIYGYIDRWRCEVGAL